MLTVSGLWRYPVKSVGGEQLATADVSELGIHGDRRFGVRDNTTGNILTGRRAAPLLLATARIEGGTAEAPHVTISLPDGSEVSSESGAAADAQLTQWLGIDVSLVAAGNAGGGTYENPMNVDDESDWVSWTGPEGAFHDSGRSRVSLLGEATAGEWELRRFRSNIILAGGAAGAEDELVGTTVSVGNTVLDVIKQIDRCIMVSRPQPGIAKDLSVLKRINAERGTFLSVGALVSRSGTVSVGDTLTPGAASAPAPDSTLG